MSAAFLGGWSGTFAGDGLEGELDSACAGAAASWGDLGIAPAEFCRYLGERAPDEPTAVLALARLSTADLYLACACQRGISEALQQFDEKLLAHVQRHLAKLRADEALVEETRQQLRVRLLVADGQATPRIAQYGGLSPLDSWVRVAAVRTALNLIAQRRPPSAEVDEDEIVADCDLELDFLRERHRPAFNAALRGAVASLPPSERALLRYQFVDGLTPGHIAAICGVHRTTILRRIAAAQALVLERTRADVMHQLQVSPSECDSLIALVQSRLHLTLTSLLGSKHA
jgi:RNA polymerase sigma-70 factor, ECF subfamily